MSLETPRDSSIPAPMLDPPPLQLNSPSLTPHNGPMRMGMRSSAVVDALVLPSALPTPTAGSEAATAGTRFPSLAPRSKKASTTPQRPSSEKRPPPSSGRSDRSQSEGSLMECVSHMSLDDVSSATASVWTPVVKQNREPLSAQQPSRETLQWLAASFSSPVSSRPLWTTPSSGKKRKTPSPQETSETKEDGKEEEDDENKHFASPPLPFVPMALPPAFMRDHHHHHTRLLKKAKSNYLLSNGSSSSTGSACGSTDLPMLPSSPDLNDQRPEFRYYHVPYFSPVGGVTMANVSFVARHFGAVESPPKEDPHARRLLGIPEAAGLPTLDDIDEDNMTLRPPSPQRAPGWLRMKRRSSLLRALRLTSSD